MQSSLIELRTENYDFRDKLVRVSEDNKNLKDKCIFLERECERANKAINRSKKARDVQIMQDDNDRLHNTVKAFEENAAQQNQTLLSELTLAVEETDRLKKSIEKCDRMPSEDVKNLREELQALMAENSVLKSSFRKESEPEETGNPELELKVATQTEQIKLLNKQLSQSTISSEDTITQLKEQVKQLELKTEHKQELIKTLHKEKELIQYEHKTKIEFDQTQLQNVQKELEISRAKFDEAEQKYNQTYLDSGAKINNLEHEIETMRSKISLVNPETVKEFETLRNENQKFRKDSRKENETILALHSEKSSIEEKLKNSSEHTAKLRQNLIECGEENQTLQDQLKESNDKMGVLETQLGEAKTELESLRTESSSAKKIADNRKSMLDQQSIDNQKRTEELLQKLHEKNKIHDDAISNHQEERTLLETQIRDLKTKLEDRLNQERTVKKLETQRTDLEGQVASLQNGISETRELLEAEIEKLKFTHSTDIATHQEEIEKLTQTVDEKERFILKFGQEKEELKLSFKIGERRNLLMIKELKKQLQQEQKRSQKITEQMNDLKQTSFTENQAGDDQESGSIGRNCDSSLSWNKSSSNWTLNNLETPLQEETKDLIDRLTSVQQQKWVLEEKCSHLEDSNIALNDDLLRKESIIKTYVVSHKADLNPKVIVTTPSKSVSRKLLNLVIPEDDEYKDESFRKVQRALEEEMTKNIHLKDNLEILTTQMDELETRLSQQEINQNAN